MIERGLKELDRALHKGGSAHAVSEASSDRFDRLRQRIHDAIYRATRRMIWGYDLRLLYGILLELYSLPSRIRILHKHKLYRYGTDLCLDTEPRPNSRLLDHRQVRDRMRGIQYLRTIHDRATQVDYWLFVSALHYLQSSEVPDKAE